MHASSSTGHLPPHHGGGSTASAAAEALSTPNFATISQKNMRQVFMGKNPKALAKNSEMWHQLKLSNDRLSRVSKGHKFWGVVSERNDATAAAAAAVSASPAAASGVLGIGEGAFDSSLAESASAYDLRVEMPMPPDPYAEAAAAEKANAENAKKLEEKRRMQTYRTLNGVRFDIASHSSVHYGMSFVIMNLADEVLCVDQHNKVCLPPTCTPCMRWLTLVLMHRLSRGCR